ncbi:MAG: hypothetical protein VYC60_00335 [Candidatus Thermoplasmatota archaeon]|nr:hypothetical protein [Candidatus Thermoplasmatota archaeon]
MSSGAVRLVSRAPSTGHSHAVLIVALLLLPALSPISAVNGEARFESSDFGILDELSNVLEERENMLESNSVGQLAGPIIEGVSNSVTSVSPSDPLSGIDQLTDGVSMVQTTPPTPVHPSTYQLLAGSEGAPGQVENIWQTLINITDYVIRTEFTDIDGNTVEKFEVVSFSASLISLLDINSEPLLHEVDVDNDGDDDIEVGLKIAWEFLGGWGVEGGTLWLEPGISFQVRVLDSSTNDPDWEQMDTLTVSLIKAFAYSGPDSILALGEGETYVWVVDSRFTTPPDEFTLRVGIERLYFDISGASIDLVTSLIQALTFGIINPGVDQSGITFASISAPYAIEITFPGGGDCPDRYSPDELLFASYKDLNCGYSAGFGYLHFSPPGDNNVRDLWELAYIELSFHPNKQAVVVPEEIEVIIRTDSVLPENTLVDGERGLTTIEYWADERTDLHIHFHENRSELPPEESSDGGIGNVTDSLGWLRGMPAGSLSEGEIERIFRMLGSDGSQSQLPGHLPDRLGFIIGIKNFSRDNSQNVDDPTLPVNPANPPKTLILLRSVQSVEELDYDSWFTRHGVEEDHRKIHINARDLPTALVLYGSFELGGSSSDSQFDTEDNLDFVSKVMDNVLINIVDLFLDIGTILNDVPSAVVDVISGGVDGASGLDGRTIHLLLTDNWLVTRSDMPLTSLSVQIGSSDHPIGAGDHLLLAKDRGLGMVQGIHGQMEPLAPVAASLRFSGIAAFSLIDDNQIDEQTAILRTASDESFSFTYIEHPKGSLENLSFQALTLSDIPDNLSVYVTPDGIQYQASTGIESIGYAGLDGNQRQAARIIGVPNSFTTTFGTVTEWSSETPISSIEAQITNSSEPVTMSGDHFLFHHDQSSETSSISARITGLSNIGWTAPEQEGASGPAGRGTAQMSVIGTQSLGINVNHAPTQDGKQLSVVASIDPLPSTIGVQIPTGSDSGPTLDVPEFNASNGISGVAFFISGIADLGRSVNSVLAGITSDISTGSESDQDFSFGILLDADSSFDLAVEAWHGTGTVPAPTWVHGIALRAAPTGISDGFYLRTWMPGLPPQIDFSVTREMKTDGEDWSISIGMVGWVPGHSELMVHFLGINGQDLLLTLQGLTVDSSTNLGLDAQFQIRSVGQITEVTTSTHYVLSERLDWVHVLLIDRTAGSRTEVMIEDIPESVDLQASIGTAISIDMVVPEEYRREGTAVGSMMLQQMQWLDSAWWPATVFLTNIPGWINLTTAPSLDFDITKTLAFQGSPTLEFKASMEGASLYIEAFGKAINKKGDVILLAEGMTDFMSIKMTESYGLSIRSGGQGVERLYIRMSNIPATPPVVLEELEALGENLQRATINVRELLGPFYSVIEIDDVQGGRIIASARASASVEDTEFDLRGVILDAQFSGGLPTGTTLGVNGMASDLSMLNMVPGMGDSNKHLMVVEPFSSAVLTILATTLGGD